MEAGVPRQAVIEREQRLARPAAIAGFVAAVLLIAGVVVHLQIPQKSNASDQLAAFSTNHQAILVSGVLVTAGLVLAAVPLAFLLYAAAARNPRVRAGFVGFCIVGPVLFGVQTIVASTALKNAGDSYVANHASEQSRGVAALKKAIRKDPSSLDQVTLYNSDDPQNTAEVQLANGDFYKVKPFAASSESSLKDSLDKADVDTTEDSSGKPGDAYANHLAVDSSGYKLAGNLALPAGITMIFAVVYPALQAYRVGLITRLLSTLGSLAAAALILLPLAPALIGIWVAWMGLVFLNRVPGGRPPAWDAGVAIPWPRPGQPATAGAPIEGNARELDPDAPPDPNPPRQRGERRKRKSRR
jgi:hypothetical protein